MNTEKDSLNSAHTAGVYIGNAIRWMIIWTFKNTKVILKIVLFGGFMLVLGALGAMIWGKRAQR